MPSALQLKNNTQTAAIKVSPPYELTVNYLGDVPTGHFAVWLKDGVPIVTSKTDEWVRDSNNELLFDVNGELIEVTPND